MFSITFKKLILAGAMVSVVFLASCKQRRFETNKLTGFEGKDMPAFNLLLPDSVTYLNTADLKKGKPTVLFFFGPDCPICANQIDSIKLHMQEMKNVQFVLFTGESFKGMKGFIETHGLGKYDNITVGRDTADYFARTFKADGYPYTAFYGEDKKLRCVFVGQMKIAQLVATAI